MDAPTIERSDTKRRYEIHIGHDRVGFSQFRDEGNHRIFTHTVIEPDYQGRGLSTDLIEWALTDTRASGMRVIAFCPTVAAYLDKHHDFDDIVDPVGTPTE